MASDKGNSEKSELTPIWENLVEGLQYVEHIAEELQLTGRLSRFKAEEILHRNKTRTEWNRGLLSDIQRTGAYDVFAQCLHVTGQQELYQLLVSTRPVQPFTKELTTLQYRVYCKDGKGDPKKIQVPQHIRQLMETQREALQGMENVERLVDLMEEEGCLTSEMTTQIKQQPSNEDKVNMLVDRVKESTLYSFFALTRFFDISQQKALMSKISEEDTKTALGRMDDLLRHVYYNLLGAIALEHSELETRLGITAHEFVTLSINIDSKAVDRRGFNEAHVDQSKAKEIKLTDLFSDQENKEPTKKVLLIGAPGTGKTTAATQLARDATTKKALNIPHPPFIILLRSLEWKNHTTFKNFLLNRGPKLEEKDRDGVWKALLKNAEEVTVFLDGADEVPDGFFKSKPDDVAGEESEALPRDILNNLISGKLLKGARVLVSSRPLNLEPCWDHFDRKVEVVGFDEASLRHYLDNELPQEHQEEVKKYLDERIDIRSLLLTPLHAATFILRANNTKDTKDLLLQSRTELSLSLIDSLVKTKLRKSSKKIPKAHLEKQGYNLRKLCKLVAELLFSDGAIKAEMTRKDLRKAEISVEECVATGVFIEQVLDEDDECESIIMVPHHSILESLAAVGLEEQQILKLVADNDGRHDLVLTYVVGILGNEKNRKMLKYVLSGEDEEKDFKNLVETVVGAVLGSKRRALQSGEEFYQRIVVESQQWDLIPDLMSVMRIRCLWSYSSESGILADQIIRHDPRGNTNDPLVRVEVDGIRNAKYCLGATSLYQHGEVTAADIVENAEHLHNITSVSFTPSAGITQKTVVGITAELSKLNNVEAVNLNHSKVGSTSDEFSDLSCLSSISSLKYMCLSHCDLLSENVVAVTSSCRHLLHLDISYNHSVRVEDVKSEELTGLIVERCDLDGDAVVEMAARNGKMLKYLNAYHNTALSSTHINDILTRCPHLVEMYTDKGGELVRALSERRVACGLNHLLLYGCDLSSLSSSNLQVSSSELSDVLMRHTSISSLTLYWCRHFTLDFMSHLSSSMAAITSLFISPNPYPRPPRSSDVASLIRSSPSLNQLWLDDDEWCASDYMEVIHAVNSSPALRVVGLGVTQLTADEVGDVVRALKIPLTRIWLAVNHKKRDAYAEVVVEGELGVVQLVSGCDLYLTYTRESGSYHQHLPPSLPDDFRSDI